VAALCLVPTPLRASRAARRLCDAEGGVLFGARVTTPDALAPVLLASASDPRPVLTPLAEALLVGEVAGALGGPFADLAPASGLLAALSAAIGELRRAEVSADEVRSAAASLGGRTGERLAAVGRALFAYEERLGALGALDGAGVLRAASEALPRTAPELRELDLFVVEGFHALSPGAFDLVAALAHRARRTVARVPFFPERPDLSGPAEPLLRRLEALHELSSRHDVSVALPTLEPGADRAPRLARMLRALAGGAAPAASGPEAGLVLAAAGAGAQGEIEAAAALAGRLLEEGFAPEDVVILAPAPGRVAAALASACAARGVPFAAGRSGPLAAHPAARAVVDALAAASCPGRAALERVALSPWVGLARVPARLGHWLDRAGAVDGRLEPEAALRARAERLASPAAAAERAALLRAADALSELTATLRPLASDGRPREHAARLRGFLAGTGARRRAARCELGQARGDVAALTRVEDAADALAGALALLGRADEPLPAARFRALLELALDRAGAPCPPEPAAGAVELWPLSEAPGLAARAAVVMGCARGTFPPPGAPEPLLRDPERLAVNRAARRAALPAGGARRAEALYVGFCALAAGREAVALTWPGPGPEGAGGAGAPLAVEALACAGVEVPAVPAADPPLASARTAAEALRAVARSARAGEGASALAALRAVAPELAPRAAGALARGALEEARRAAVLSGRASPAAGALPAALVPELGRALPDEWSPSDLELHARCPYQLFAARVLGLAEPEAAELDIDPRDEGRLVHVVLERFLRARLERGALPLTGGAGEAAELRAVAEALFARFEADGRVGDAAVWPARRAAVQRRLARVLAAEVEAGDGLVPALLEFRFGGDSGVPPLVLRDGADEVKLRGRLDRVDASPDRLLLIDYKDSRGGPDYKKKLSPEALGETNFQVPAYLLAAARALPGRARLEATYLLLRTAERLPPYAATADDPLLAGGFAEATVALVRTIRGGALPIASRDCRGCPWGALCRFEGVAEGEP
jgi:RecB family exonuclease